MLTLTIFQTVDFSSVRETLSQYADPASEQSAEDPKLGLLLDFLSPSARDSLLKGITQQVVDAYSTDQAPSVLVEQALEIHPLGAVLSTQWRASIVECIKDLYPDLSENPFSPLA